MNMKRSRAGSLPNKKNIRNEKGDKKNMERKRKKLFKATIAFAVALAFILPGSAAFASDESSVRGMKRELVTETYAIESASGIKTISSYNSIMPMDVDFQLIGLDTDDISPSLAANRIGGVMVAADIELPDLSVTTVGFKYSSDDGATWPSDEDIVIFDFGGNFPDIDLPDLDYNGIGAFGTLVPISDTSMWTMNFPDVSDPEAGGGWSAITWTTQDPVNYAAGAGVNELYAPSSWTKGIIVASVNEPGRDYDWYCLWQSGEGSASSIHYPNELPWDVGCIEGCVDLTTGRFYDVYEYFNYEGYTDGLLIEWVTLDGTSNWWQGSWSEKWIATGGYACPDIIADDGNCYVVYEQNGDIMCTYTHNNGGSWQTQNITETVEIERSPEITIDPDGNPTCIFTLAEDLYVVNSVDDGVTWSTPEQVNDNPGTVVAKYGCADLDYIFSAWTDDRNGNDDIYFDIIAPPPDYPVLNITEVKGGLGVSATIKNTGDASATNVNWNITVKGGIFGFIRKTVGGVIPSLAVDEESDPLETGLILGLGSIDITVTAICDEGPSATNTTDGWQIIIFTWIPPYTPPEK